MTHSPRHAPPALLPSARPRRATILIVVLWIMTGLACVTLYFCDAMRVEFRASDNGAREAEARQAIDGMRRYLVHVFTNWSQPGVAPVAGTDYMAEKVPIGAGQAWLVGRAPELEKQGKELAFGLVDEGSKLNINTASLEMLQALPNMPSSLAASIVNWRSGTDNASATAAGGAQARDYLALTPAYACKSAPFETLEELRLVIGADLDTLNGEDANGNGVLDPNEDDSDVSWPPDNHNGKIDCGLFEYLTVYSREPNTTSSGERRINFKTAANFTRVRDLLIRQLGARRATEILAQLRTLSRINSPLEFHMRGGMTADEFAKVEPSLTVSDQPYLTGLVNVNTASKDVLACIPGLDAATAETIVAERERQSAQALASIAWLASVLKLDQAAQAGPWLTVRSFVYTADIGAVGAHGRGFQREHLVLDTCAATPKILYRRDRTRLGWPLGTAIRQQLDTEN